VIAITDRYSSTMLNPYMALDQDALAQTCEARVHELQARAWSTPAEREALREQTALLLDAAARRLAADAAANAAARSRAAPALRLHDFLGQGDHADYVDALHRAEAQLRGWRPFGGPIEGPDGAGGDDPARP
jgi:hypothetical protein